jgi:PAS domain-containing protein
MSAHKELQRLRELLSCHRKDHFDIDASELMELRIALDQAGHGIVILDKDLRSQLINQAFCNIWRLPLERARLHLLSPR